MNLHTEIQAFKSKVKVLNYRDVLIDHDRNNPNKPIKFFNISEFCKVADQLGYPYLLWNSIIYHKDDCGRWMRTTFTEQNIQ